MSVQTPERRAKSLLRKWAAEHTNAIGEFTGHYPIDDSLHGNQTTVRNAWGCNSCGHGWPCLTVQTLRFLEKNPS